VSGFRLLEDLRRKHAPAELPVIMATAVDRTADVVEALRLGANDYVTKPFNFPVVLARVRTQLALKRAGEQLTRAHQRLKRDLEAAATVQKALLPPRPLTLPGATFAWEFRPCNELGGDLLDVRVLDGRHVALYVLDVSGHGVKAALLAVMIHRVLAQLLASAGPQPVPPVEVAARLGRLFPWNDQTEQYFTLLYGLLDLQGGSFRFVSAGHPEPLLLPRDGGTQALKASGLPIGLGDGGYEERVLTLRAGDRLYLHSDGLPDALNAEDGAFGRERVCRLLEQGRAASLGDGLGGLLREVEVWCGPCEPHDDISILAVERV
jgi:sigma-B regulation protein RsbU (phosphoserine phosphatase)